MFRKTNGRLDDAVAVLLAPYLLGAWINSRWWTRKQARPIAVVPGLWLSRLPGKSEIDRVGPQALVDCCAELPVKNRGRPLYAVPLLDLLVPEVVQIEHGVTALCAARTHGTTLVFCALGFSRSASIVIAWLVDQGYAASIHAAIAMLRKAHPSLVLSSAHIAQLEAWHATRVAR